MLYNLLVCIRTFEKMYNSRPGIVNNNSVKNHKIENGKYCYSERRHVNI